MPEEVAASSRRCHRVRETFPRIEEPVRSREQHAMAVNVFEELLDFAIDQEEEAREFYRHLAQTVKAPHLRDALLGFALQEAQHKAKLEAVRSRGSVEPPTTPIADLKVSDYLVAVEPSSDLDYRAALVIAMQREKAAYRLYQDLGRHCQDPELKEVFRFLAQEEASHKLMFETEYDDLLAEH
jgi:rubrerythrin